MSFQYIFNKHFKIILLSTFIGSILQVLCKNYIDGHPEMFKNIKHVNVKSKSGEKLLPKSLAPRGGGLIEITGISVEVAAKVLISYLAENGTMAGVLAGLGYLLYDIPPTQLSKYLRDASPQIVYTEKNFSMVPGKNNDLAQCEESLMYVFNILKDDAIPFEEKDNLVSSIFTKYIDFITPAGIRNFVLCIIAMISIFAFVNQSAVHILFKYLIKAVKEGRISKAVARYIVKKLRNKGVPINPELMEVIDEAIDI